MCIGSGRRAASRLFKLQTLKTQPQPPKNTARTLKIQRAACYSRVSGYVSAHLAHVKNRSWQRVARIRIYTGKLTQNSHKTPEHFRGKFLVRHIYLFYFYFHMVSFFDTG